MRSQDACVGGRGEGRGGQQQQGAIGKVHTPRYSQAKASVYATRPTPSSRSYLTLAREGLERIQIEGVEDLWIRVHAEVQLDLAGPPARCRRLLEGVAHVEREEGRGRVGDDLLGGPQATCTHTHQT